MTDRHILMLAWLHTFKHTCMQTYIHQYTDIHVCQSTYICHGNKYVPYYDRVLMFWQGNPSLLDYDDVITLCCW